MNDGVFNVMKDQNAPSEIEGQMTSNKIKELIDLGVRFFYCSQCLETRGIKSSQITDNIEKSNLPKLAGFIKNSEKVLTF
jgi:predicted peroxiredoxin